MLLFNIIPENKFNQCTSEEQQGIDRDESSNIERSTNHMNDKNNGNNAILSLSHPSITTKNQSNKEQNKPDNNECYVCGV